ncbi:hypothetical protein NGRA_0727 [Nosema granulosis]|uniref:Uncharacterized protein n=1 Tax=Nosema granulosis TaxID=83296 RepID=A0A9P6H0W0_9MICR|nr:hypothetical protein NGRA_0727 [Nosema granulosis]
MPLDGNSQNLTTNKSTALEDVIIGKISPKTVFYYGRIVDKNKGSRMHLDSLNPVVLSVLPPLFKFKRFINETLYNQAISRIKTSTRYTDTVKIYYDGSYTIQSNIRVDKPKTMLFIHLPNKPCDIMVACYTTEHSKDSQGILETLEREIVEGKTSEYIIQCIKATKECGSTAYEVHVDVLKNSVIKNLIFDLFEDTHCRKKIEEEIDI